jgi:hypothetical protein
MRTGVDLGAVLVIFRRGRSRWSPSIHSFMKGKLMSSVVILNAVLAIFVVAGILSLMGWAIAADRAVAAPHSGRSHAPARHRTATIAPVGVGPALDLAAE